PCIGDVLGGADVRPPSEEFPSVNFSPALSSGMACVFSADARSTGSVAGGHPQEATGVSTESSRPSRNSTCCSGLISYVPLPSSSATTADDVLPAIDPTQVLPFESALMAR